MFKKKAVCALAVSLYYLISFATPTFAHEINNIHMQDSGFSPQSITIDQGTTVLFENSGTLAHWPASNIHPTHDIYPEFDPKKPIPPGQSWQFTFDKAGEWRFHDHLFPEFTGTIIVRENINISQKQQVNIPVDVRHYAKTRVLSLFFHFFPDAKEKYLARQQIKHIIDAQDEKELTVLIQLYDPKKVMNKLFDESNGAKLFNCHPDAHKIGRLSYTVLGAQALGYSTTLCNSGYVHGAVAAFVKEKGTHNLVGDFSSLCSQSQTNFGQSMCYHSVGHGLLAYYDYDLPKAIAMCKNFDTQFKQNNCLVGTFMENIGTVTGDSLSPHRTQWISTKDPYFPCNTLDQDLQSQKMCFNMQPAWMLNLFNQDMDKVLKACLGVKEDAAANCFFGYGEVVALAAKFEPQKTLSLCEKVPKTKNYVGACLYGAQTMFMDFWGQNLANKGYQFCAVFPEDDKKKCLKVLEERMQDLGQLAIAYQNGKS